MNSEDGVSGHDLNISIFEVERLVVRGDIKCGGGGSACWDLNKGLGGRLHAIQDRSRGNALQDGGRDVDIDRGDGGDGEILRGKSDRCINPYGDSTGRPILSFGF